ncbi:1,4-alpha-glucan branching protein domain-containing protein [Conexibacter sp. DBS9H8]|uniref:1,4-alpha-glucan branching protein domain-containing protein n=1 Tax=Conexibacter sp. DBS9H8 TaxID=2937801 RepID=UPI00200DFECA|nr:1,4-alpha-glucan branching protein domain-containing protein [Conexibacter sp. DBS9H8]
MPARTSQSAGVLAIVLHTHMPYVEGFGTWPFGEEWLWEAIATSYLPLLEVLDPRVTLSLTPVLADQLEAAGAIGRAQRFLDETREASHALDLEHYAEEPAALRALERSRDDYRTASVRLASLTAEGGLLGALAGRSAWTSSATHAILPLLALDDSVTLQLELGVGAHRRRSGDWDGGFWLPECAYAPWLNGHLESAGVHHCCVQWPGVDPGRPLATAEGPWLWPVDRTIIDLVWGETGYPSAPEYRARGRLTPRHHRIWANDGTVYDPDRAAAAAARDGVRFVAAVCARVAEGGICTLALDTELLGHWWCEGPQWLAAVLAEADRVGLGILRPEQIDVAPGRAPEPSAVPAVSWGEGGDLRTWSSGPAADLAFRLRSAELRAFAAPGRPSPRALRELLAAQASDWTFLAYRGWAGDYPRERLHGHLRGLADALTGRLTEPALANLAPDLDR